MHKANTLMTGESGDVKENSMLQKPKCVMPFAFRASIALRQLGICNNNKKEYAITRIAPQQPWAIQTDVPLESCSQ